MTPKLAKRAPCAYLPRVATVTFVEFRAVGTAALARITCSSVGLREAEIVEAALKEIATGSKGRLVVDMTEVKVLGSMGLGVLVTLTKQCRTSGGRLALFGVESNLLELIKLTRLDNFLFIARDEPAALKAVL